MQNPTPPLQQPLATVISAPAGLTVKDSEGNAYPIVALRVEGSEITPLHLDKDNTVQPVPRHVPVSMSEAWLPRTEIPYRATEATRL